MINYKGKLLARESLQFQAINRGLAFGDGLFETIMVSESTIPLLDLHWNRLSVGLNTLCINSPFTKITLLEYIQNLIIAKKERAGTYRVKLIIWRSGGGKYSPESNDADFIIEANAIEVSQTTTIAHCFTSKKVTLYKTLYSHLKTISALQYVIASQEKKQRGVEELLIKNHEGMLAEATAGNIFIYDHDECCFYTPPLESACINGVMRKHILNGLQNEGKSVTERAIAPDEVIGNVSLFLTNVAGIRQVLNFENRQLIHSPDLFSYLCALSQR
ncbi:MAG: branched-subunit amino acid aminotransferase/4-amino-4-deoxychorismate lyase [Marivirga sp.]|jgi:branched-subunit amino acid aminotransferase/4-amino-4-deoxychorismate lyase